MCFFSVLPDTVHEELKWTSAENLIESQEVQLHYNENHMEIKSFQDFMYSRVHKSETTKKILLFCIFFRMSLYFVPNKLCQFNNLSAKSMRNYFNDSMHSTWNRLYVKPGGSCYPIPVLQKPSCDVYIRNL